MKITILLVDDHPIFRKGLLSLLDYEEDMTVVGEAGDGQSAIDLIRKLRPDIAVMDITMPGMSGIEATEHIVSQFPGTKIIALSIHSDKQFVEDMLKAGASGYILKESVPEDLVKGIRTVMAGEAYLSPSITAVVISQYKEILDHGLSGQSSYTEILETKLYPPPAPDDHIHRQKLVDRLTAGQNLPLVIVSAPAGYGKSVLVSFWMQSCDLPSAWVSLDKSDNDLRQFFGYFLSAIKTIFPDAGIASLSLLDSVKFPPIQILANHLKKDLAMIEQDFILVLDDFHVINEKPVHDLIAEVLRHPPKNFHLVLIGRKDPFLPISSLRARGQLAELRVQDLRFTVDETLQYLKGMFQEEIDETTAASWTKLTEGWITGLRLAALSMHHMEDFDLLLDELHGDAQYVMEYLFNEVLAHQPSNIRRCLLEISIVDRFCGELCSVLCGLEIGTEHGQNGWDFISLLKKENMFIIKLDAENHWFRFHHLFQQLLQNQLHRHFRSSEIAELHSRASGWFAGNGFLEDAIRHAVAADDMDRAIRLVTKNRQTMLNQDRWFVLEKWLSMFPETVVLQNPELLLAKAWAHYHHFDIQHIPLIIDSITQQLGDTPEDKVLQGEVDFFLGYILYFQNKGVQSLEHLQKALQRVPEQHYEIQGQIEIIYGLSSQMQGDIEEARTRLNDLLYKYKNVKSTKNTRLLVTLVFISIISGNLPEATLTNLQLLNSSQKSRYRHAALWSEYLQGLICFFQNDLEQSILRFKKALENKYILHTRAVLDCMTGLALAYDTTGEPDKARAAVEALIEFVTPFNDPGYTMVTQSCQARLSILHGDLKAVSGWLQRSLPDNENMVWWLEIPIITYCRVLLASGSDENLEKAGSVLQELIQQNQTNNNICQMIQIMPIQAMVYQAQGQNDEAFNILEEAINLASSGGWIRPFVELGPPMEEMLKQLSEKNVAKDFIGQLLDAFRFNVQKTATTLPEDEAPVISSPAHPDSQSLVDPLTNRELEILNLLAQNLYNKEIGEKLYISTETVKTHLKGIYQKLEAGNRREAVAKARDLGILQ